MAKARNTKVDPSFRNAKRWREESLALRENLLDFGLDEELKWNKPCYCHDGKNICIIQRMTGFLALLFFKGALLKDPDGVLERQGPNSRSGFRMRFTSVADVTENTKTLKALIRNAIEVEQAGLKVEKSDNLEMPQELIDRLDSDPKFREAFEDLTPGRQRGYVFHFRDAKQSKTRAARIEKFRARILQGKGLHDR